MVAVVPARSRPMVMSPRPTAALRERHGRGVRVSRSRRWRGAGCAPTLRRRGATSGAARCARTRSCPGRAGPRRARQRVISGDVPCRDTRQPSRPVGERRRRHHHRCCRHASATGSHNRRPKAPSYHCCAPLMPRLFSRATALDALTNPPTRLYQNFRERKARKRESGRRWAEEHSARAS
jgi:hypothetical protein